MKEETGTFNGVGGVEIFHRAWLPDNLRAAVIIAHGLGEHCGRYQHVAQAMVEHDLAVFALDHRGHGRSGGKRGHVSAFSEYTADLDALRRKVEERTGDLPRFLLGHSMGGLIAATYAVDYGQGLSGLVLSSAAFRTDVEVPAVKLALGKLMSRIFPGLTLSNELDPNNVSRDAAVVKAYVEDPLVHDRVSARWFTEFTAAMERIHERAHEITIPVLVMQSGADKLVAPRGAREFFDRLTVEDKTFQEWEGLYHEMMNEPEQAKPIGLAIKWIEDRIG